MSDFDYNALARSVPCAFCKAKAGKSCRTVTPRQNGAWTLKRGCVTTFHAARIRQADATRQAQLRGRESS